MVELESHEHKQKKTPFWPDKKIFFGVGTNTYDAAYKMVDQKIDPSAVVDEVFAEVEQGIKDLQTCVDDIESARLGFADFGVTDMGENNMYLLLDVTDKKVVDAARSDLKKRIKASPEKNFFVVMVFACHGLQMDGKQTIVINAFNVREGYYHRMNAEHDI